MNNFKFSSLQELYLIFNSFTMFRAEPFSIRRLTYPGYQFASYVFERNLWPINYGGITISFHPMTEFMLHQYRLYCMANSTYETLYRLYCIGYTNKGSISHLISTSIQHIQDGTIQWDTEIKIILSYWLWKLTSLLSQQIISPYATRRQLQ